MILGLLALILATLVFVVVPWMMRTVPLDESFSLSKFGGWVVMTPGIPPKQFSQDRLNFAIVQLFPDEKLSEATQTYPEYSEQSFHPELILSPLDHDVEDHVTKPDAAQSILNLCSGTYPNFKGMYFSVAYSSLMQPVTEVVTKMHDMRPDLRFIVRLPRNISGASLNISSSVSSKAFIDVLVPAFTITHQTSQICDPATENGWSTIARWLDTVTLLISPQRIYLGFPGFVHVHEGHQPNFRCGSSRLVDLPKMREWQYLHQYKTWNEQELSWIYDVPSGVKTPLGTKGYWVMFDDPESLRKKISRARSMYGVDKVCFYTLDSFRDSDFLEETSKGLV